MILEFRIPVLGMHGKGECSRAADDPFEYFIDDMAEKEVRPRTSKNPGGECGRRLKLTPSRAFCPLCRAQVPLLPNPAGLPALPLTPFLLRYFRPFGYFCKIR